VNFFVFEKPVIFPHSKYLYETGINSLLKDCAVAPLAYKGGGDPRGDKVGYPGIGHY